MNSTLSPPKSADKCKSVKLELEVFILLFILNGPQASHLHCSAYIQTFRRFAEKIQ
jgi:hypothetical protein